MQLPRRQRTAAVVPAWGVAPGRLGLLAPAPPCPLAQLLHPWGPTEALPGQRSPLPLAGSPEEGWWPAA